MSLKKVPRQPFGFGANLIAGAILLLIAITCLCAAQQTEQPAATEVPNECTYPGKCDSTKSTAACHICRDGYVKDPLDDKRCKSENITASLLISEHDGIKQITLDGLKTTQHLKKGSNILSIDYNLPTKEIFWFSYTDRKMFNGHISEDPQKSIVVNDPASYIPGLSFDWINEHIYWTDVGTREISVMCRRKPMKKVLIKDDLVFPSSIAVNPLNGWMHWADFEKHRIERAAMDGTRREVIISTDIHRPRGITLDFDENRIYWTQNEPSSISSSNFDGSDRKLIFAAGAANQQQQPNLSGWFSSLISFGDHVLWIAHSSKTIYRVNKCDNGGNLVAVHKSEQDLLDVVLYDASRQPLGENHCAKREEKCSHFCFPVPVSVSASASAANESISTSCACPDGLSPSADGNTCN